MNLKVVETYEELSKEAAKIIATQIHQKPNTVLGLATGSSPIGLYKELIRLHKEEGLDFSQVVTFNLDEYEGFPPDHPQSYAHFMKENLFDHVNIPSTSIHVPKGIFASEEEANNFGQWYEEQIKKFGGIDLQLLGVGTNGHLAFNEPGSGIDTRTRRVALTEETRKANSRFFKADEKVPTHAISMGLGTLLEARHILLIASLNGKAEVIQKVVEGEKVFDENCPASIVRIHPKADVIVSKDGIGPVFLLRGEPQISSVLQHHHQQQQQHAQQDHHDVSNGNPIQHHFLLRGEPQ